LQKDKKMRNTSLTKKRDLKMIEAFHELYDIKRIRLDDVLKKMSDDLFYLDQNYIYKRIFYVSDNYAYYEELKKNLETK